MNVDLFESLKELRSRISKEKGIPPFVIYNDAAIKALIEYRPSTSEELKKIKFPKSSITKYGSRILKTINERK